MEHSLNDRPGHSDAVPFHFPGALMTQVLYGPRLGKLGQLRFGCCAVIFDDRRQKVLLTRRADNGLWCLPGGAMDPGESVEECCQREVREETGLEVRLERLIGVYSNRDQLVIYPDGNKVQIVVVSFEAYVSGGSLGLSNETTEAGYFTPSEMSSMPMHGRHLERVEDALLNQATVILR
jgi:ADP-ribose pyrophosphatase YjhB (NUDIX family)